MDVSISIHVPLAGNDFPCTSGAPPRIHFNPRSPRGERRPGMLCREGYNPISIHVPLAGNDLDRQEAAIIEGVFQSTFPSRGTTPWKSPTNPSWRISIHVPLAGNDVFMVAFTLRIADFNPRSPRGERHRIPESFVGVPYFNPRSPRGERLPCRA